ncbi:hypothetical protein [Streptomyces sp. NPDC001927]
MKHISVRTRNRARGIVAFLAASAVFAAAGCTSNTESPETNGPTSQAPSVATSESSPPDSTEVAKKEAIATYEAYWQEMAKLYANPLGKASNLKQYAAATALISAEKDVKETHAKGNLIVGEVNVERPTVTNLDTSRKTLTTTLSSCLDVSRWIVVESSTKKPITLPAKRLTKYVIVSTVERWPDGWKVIKDEPQGKAC